ncbi:aldehyde ferredoxin oxidoreductase N-terminal domain-containing protein [Desulfitobacterium sp.]|nr:aldehyde ferredoxin oxidoreductase N-terminal domain-containing protein [Desulfitobacterium sp.]HVJ49453.1 aldehyde ferredoxin oxidoreductase N-terminal domain-containing protein [Desulfitobacterium sp.]
MELAKKYLSGRGLAGKMFIDEVPANVDALSPEDKMFIAKH